MSANILKALAVTAELTGTELSAPALRVMSADLEAYPEPAVLAALTRCRRELTGRLTLAGILDRISDGRPGPEEAWAIALASADETETVVWTEEISQAYAVAAPILEARDKVGARMAFREAYERILRDAKAAGAPCVWSPSLGTDPQRRALAIAAAVDAGRMTMDMATAYLPAPVAGGPVAALISGDNKALLAYAGDPSARRGIEMVRAELKRLDDEAQRRREAHEAERMAREEEFRRRKQAAMDAVDRLLAERGREDNAA